MGDVKGGLRGRGRVEAAALRALRGRHGLSLWEAAALARVEPWAWAYWEERGMPRDRVGAFELVALKTMDRAALAIVARRAFF